MLSCYIYRHQGTCISADAGRVQVCQRSADQEPDCVTPVASATEEWQRKVRRPQSPVSTCQDELGRDWVTSLQAVDLTLQRCIAGMSWDAVCACTRLGVLPPLLYEH